MTSQLVFLYRHQRRSPRRWWALLVVLLVALAGFATAQAAPVCTTNGNQGTCTFTYTGAAERWVVPPHATQATFDLYGAQGGGRYAGGRGGRATASLLLTPGAVYQITVGGEGGELTGGFNGGGQGGGVPGSNPASGGGGASDIRTGNFGLADRILVAGGGGGSGHCCASSDGVEGGAGGYPSGGDGQAGETRAGVPLPGGGGGSQLNGVPTGGAGAGDGADGDVGVGGNGGGTFGDYSGGGGGGYVHVEDEAESHADRQINQLFLPLINR